MSLDASPQFQIYCLLEPDSSEIRYVGITTRSLKRRLQLHCYATSLRKNTHRSAWIKSLLRDGMQPIIRLLEDCSSEGEMREGERLYIEYFKWLGRRLVNSTAGGECANPRQGNSLTQEHKDAISRGNKGKKWTEEMRKRHSDMRKRTPPTPAQRAALAKATDAIRGKPKKPETLAKLSAAKKGKPGKSRTEAEKQHLSDYWKGRVFSEEHLKKIRVGLLAASKRKREERSAARG